LEKHPSHSSPIARRAEQTVLLPVHKSMSSNKVKAFFQEGLEKSTEKGRGTDKMLCDRKSIRSCTKIDGTLVLVQLLRACFFVSAK
jgi:hypothetical protein